MVRIKIKNLPKGMKVSDEELKSVRGGLDVAYSRSFPTAIVSSQPIRYTGDITTQIDWGSPAFSSKCNTTKMASWPSNAPDCPPQPVPAEG